MGPGYGITLAEALVSEGLADHFVADAFPDTPPQPWDNALAADQETALWRKAQSVLEVPAGYNHRTWFFGGGDLPRWAGYTLGYRIAEAYLGDDFSASSAVGTEAGTVIERYVRDWRGSKSMALPSPRFRERTVPLGREKDLISREVPFLPGPLRLSAIFGTCMNATDTRGENPGSGRR
jgi:hypothetical protein